MKLSESTGNPWFYKHLQLVNFWLQPFTYTELKFGLVDGTHTGLW